MSDYTPTTEQVKNEYSYASSHARHRYGYTSKDYDAEFDRWLAEVKAQAWDEGYVSSDDYYGEHDNPYRQGEGSENSNFQPTAETPTYLNRQGENK